MKFVLMSVLTKTQKALFISTTCQKYLTAHIVQCFKDLLLNDNFKIPIMQQDTDSSLTFLFHLDT